MLEYLKAYVSPEEYDFICANLSPSLSLDFQVMENNVSLILSYLSELGIKNLSKIIVNRPELCFRDKEVLCSQFNQINQDLLIKLIEEDLDTLICFNI